MYFDYEDPPTGKEIFWYWAKIIITVLTLTISVGAFGYWIDPHRRNMAMMEKAIKEYDLKKDTP